MNYKNKWWENALRKFEPTLPEPFRKDLDFIFSFQHQTENAAKLNRDLVQTNKDHLLRMATQHENELKALEEDFFDLKNPEAPTLFQQNSVAESQLDTNN